MCDYSFFITTFIIAVCPLFNLIYTLRKINYSTYKEIRSLHVKINMLIYNNEQLQTKVDELLGKKEFVEETESESESENNVSESESENNVSENEVKDKNVVTDKNDSPIESMQVEDILYNKYNIDKSLDYEHFLSYNNNSSKKEDGEFINYDEFEPEKKHKSWLNFLY